MNDKFEINDPKLVMVDDDQVSHNGSWCGSHTVENKMGPVTFEMDMLGKQKMRRMHPCELAQGMA